MCGLYGLMLTCSVCVLQCTVFVPEKIPFEQLGVFGTFCRHLVDNHTGLMYKG